MNVRRTQLAIGLITSLALVAAACGGDGETGADTTSPPTAAATTAPAPAGDGEGSAGTAAGTTAIADTDCPFEPSPALADRIRCAELTVPENRDDPRGRTVTVPFAQIEPAEPRPDSDTLLFVMGGNGSGLLLLQGIPELGEALARDARVIFVDHRGSAPWSTPYMACDGFAEGLDAAEADADPAEVEACREQLAAKLDLNLYGPWEAALDYRDLRLALGVERWDVYSVSYGTTIAQRMITVDGDAIASMVFDGTWGATANGFSPTFLLEPLIGLIDECNAAAECAAAFPDLERQLGEVAARLAETPQEIDGATVSDIEYLAGIRVAMGDPERRGSIPLAVARSAVGDFGPWQEIAALPEDGGGADPALTWPSSVCRDEHSRRDDPSHRRNPSRALPDAVVSGVRMLESESWDWDRFCPAMGFVRSADQTVEVVRSDVPALMLVGQIDLVTPKYVSDDFAEDLDNADTVVFPLTGHFTLLGQFECATGIVLDFVADPTAPIDRSCVDALPTVTWATA